jgi:hypothetical protein
MTTDDLSILADALTFALLATGAGLVMWAVARATWRRRGLRRTMKVGMSTTALVAVGLAGIAMWPAARDGVNGIPGLGPPQDQTENPSSQDSAPDLVPPSPEVLRTRSGGGPVGTGQSSDPSSSDPSSSDPSSDQATDPSSTDPPTIDPTDPPSDPPTEPSPPPPTDPPTQPPPTDPPSQPPPTDPPTQPPPTDPPSGPAADPLIDLPPIDLTIDLSPLGL